MNRLWTTLLALFLVGSIVMDFTGPAKEVHHIWDLKTFFAVFGFGGCLFLIFVSKWIGKAVLEQPENYYDPYRVPAEVGEELEDDHA